MPSSFYSQRVLKRFPVSYLFLEVFASLCEKSSAISAPEAIASTLQSLGVKPPYTPELLSGIAEDLEAIRRSKESSKSSKPSKGRGGRSVGSEMLGWLGSLDLETTLLIASDYDYEAAAKLYSECPVQVVDRIVSTRIEAETHRINAMFEAIVFGTGGKMKGGSPADKVMDASAPEANADVQAQLKKFRFM